MTNKTLKKIVNYSVQIAEPERIILFGSVASGKQNIYSDLDLLVVTNTIHDRRNLANQINSFVSEMALESDILIYSEKEIEKAALAPFSFLGSIAKEGKIIYQKQS